MIGFLGGTGPEGRGLALRFALVGEQVLIGSRQKPNAICAAKAVSEIVPGISVDGGSNEDVIHNSELIFVTVPYLAQKQLLKDFVDHLEGKVVVDTVVPISFNEGVAVSVPVLEGSAALEARAVLHKSILVAAFQTISAHDLLKPDRKINSDVIVCSDNDSAKQDVMKLAEKIAGIRSIDGGRLANSQLVENLTILLLNINKLYKVRSSVKIVGI